MRNVRDEGIFSAPWIPSDMGYHPNATQVRTLTGAAPGYAGGQVASAPSGFGAPTMRRQPRTTHIPCPPRRMGGDGCFDAFANFACRRATKRDMYWGLDCNPCVTVMVSELEANVGRCRELKAHHQVATSG